MALCLDLFSEPAKANLCRGSRNGWRKPGDINDAGFVAPVANVKIRLTGQDNEGCVWGIFLDGVRHAVFFTQQTRLGGMLFLRIVVVQHLFGMLKHCRQRSDGHRTIMAG